MNRSDAGSDAALVASCAAGDESALQELYDRHAASCLSLARAVLGEGAAGEGVVSETFLEAWAEPHRFDDGRATVGTWLLLIAHRRAVIAPRERSAPAEAGALSGGRGRPALRAVTPRLSREARESLTALTPAEREALVLACWGGFSHREIASLTESSLPTARRRLRDAVVGLGATTSSGRRAKGRLTS